MALTAADLLKLRRLTGGVVKASEPDYLTDAELQAEFAAAGGAFDLAVVYVLRLRVAMTAPLTDRAYAIEQTSESLSQRHAHLRALLADAEARLGLGGARLTVGVMDLGLDKD